MTIKNIGLFGKFKDSSVADAVEQVRDFLESRNLSVLLGSTTSAEIKGDRLDDQDQSTGDLLDLAIVVGGDGTMLNAARLLSEYGVPAIGINLGRLGFLTDIPLSDLDKSLTAILQGNYSIEERTMLKCQVMDEGKEVFTGIALNDIVVSKGNTGRLIEFEIRVNEQRASHPRSDGVILSTPTGSTAYALSAGGPIIYPGLPVISMSPICPHTLSNRPIILDENARIQVTSIKTHESPANLTLDGVLCCQIHGSEDVNVSRAPKKLQLIRIDGFNYFETLQSKLGWQP